MPTVADIFAQALQQFDAGNLAQAEQLCRQLVTIEPRHGDAWNLLGVIAYRGQQYAQAIEYMQAAVAAHPQAANFHLNLGVYWKCAGNIPAAIASYQQAIQLNPHDANAHFNLGNLYRQQRQAAEALACYQRALQLDPNAPHVLNNLGNAWRDAGKHEQAKQCYEKTLQLAENFHETWLSLGNLHLQHLQDYATAEKCFRRLLEVNPHSAEIHTNLSLTLLKQQRHQEAWDHAAQALRIQPDCVQALLTQGEIQIALQKLEQAEQLFQKAASLAPQRGTVWYFFAALAELRGQWKEAEKYYVHAISLDPQDANVWSDYGELLAQLKRLQEAEAAFRRSMELKPQHYSALTNLGAVLQDLHRFAEAEACYLQAKTFAPHRYEILHNLGNLAMRQQASEKAVYWFAQAWELKPEANATLCSLIHQQQHICDWTNLAERTHFLIDHAQRALSTSKGAPLSPFSFITLPLPTPAEHQFLITKHWSDYFCGKFVHSSQAQPHHTTKTSRKIHIGYLSADLHEHATAYLIAELFEKHDRTRFHISAYSLGQNDASAMRQRLQMGVDAFVDLHNASYEESAHRIRHDEVDILIDLKGYTYGCQPQILAQRPAPIQVNYLGYPGTMAANFMDYILVDAFVVPPDQQPFYAEKLVYLPGCYQVNDSQRPIAARTPTRAECGLPAHGFVFCSFNNSYKITPDMFTLWMRLLQAVPQSVLWLLENNRWAASNLQREAANRGVDPQRLVFAPRLPLAEHLARYRLADLFLDTYPVNAHTTASDALWTGLPVLTCIGETFVSRVAGSLLHAVGLPQLIAKDLQQYEKMALQLAAQPTLIQQLKTHLQHQQTASPLFNATRFARNLEGAYEQMWQRYGNGLPPASFQIQEQPARENPGINKP
jgi:protein O-GlcNAc transferase